MKHPLTLGLGLVAALLAAALFFIKTGDNNRIAVLDAALTDSSNRVETATAQITVRDGQLLTLSNALVAASATASAVSNELAQTQNVLAEQKQSVQKANASLTELNDRLETLTRAHADATNDLAAANRRQLATQTALEETSGTLKKLQADYSVLGKRLQEDVAARVVLERRWQAPVALQEQLTAFKRSPQTVVTPERIYAGLNVEVQSNGTIRVLSPE